MTTKPFSELFLGILAQTFVYISNIPETIFRFFHPKKYSVDKKREKIERLHQLHMEAVSRSLRLEEECTALKTEREIVIRQNKGRLQILEGTLNKATVLEKELQHQKALADRDELTGFWNWGSLQSVFALSVASFARNIYRNPQKLGPVVTAAYVDIRWQKGEPRDESMIATMAVTLSSHIGGRQYDLRASLGDGCFLFVFPEADGRIGKTIERGISKCFYQYPEVLNKVVFHMGMATAALRKENSKTLLEGLRGQAEINLAPFLAPFSPHEALINQASSAKVVALGILSKASGRHQEARAGEILLCDAPDGPIGNDLFRVIPFPSKRRGQISYDGENFKFDSFPIFVNGTELEEAHGQPKLHDHPRGNERMFGIRLVVGETVKPGDYFDGNDRDTSWKSCTALQYGKPAWPPSAIFIRPVILQPDMTQGIDQERR